MSFVKVIAFEEGFRAKPYKDSKGYPTIGYGIKLASKDANIDHFECEIPEPVARLWLEYHAAKEEAKLCKYSWFMHQKPDVQDILISMSYQLGLHGLLGFKKMIAALCVNDMETAAKEALDSKWARIDSPNRAKRHARVIKGESIDDVYRNLI
ncbi:putative lysozyme [Vibrio phage vB_VaS_L1]|nr:putative lysozyme [Vibrio phage vB_VaS_L1]